MGIISFFCLKPILRLGVALHIFGTTIPISPTIGYAGWGCWEFVVHNIWRHHVGYSCSSFFDNREASVCEGRIEWARVMWLQDPAQLFVEPYNFSEALRILFLFSPLLSPVLALKKLEYFNSEGSIK